MKVRIILLVALFFAADLSVQGTYAATITVQDTGDGAANAANCPGAGCRLRDALAAASSGDTIDFSVTTSATITLTSNRLLIVKNLTINGPGANQLTVSGNNADIVFHVFGAYTVKISGLTITKGNSFAFGGGIFNQNGTLTVNNCTVSANSAYFGGGIQNYGEVPLLFPPLPATLTVTNSTFSGNVGIFGGGAIRNTGQSLNGSATATISNCTFSSNSALGGVNPFGLVSEGGGAIENIGTDGYATLTVSNSTLSANSANRGGGIYNNHATLTVSKSTLSANAAGDNSEVVQTNGRGGGIYNDHATLTVSKSTLRGNSVSTHHGVGEGGGIYNDGSSGSAALTVSKSILRGNSAGDSSDPLGGNGAGGGIFNDGSSNGNATVMLNNSTLSDNSIGTIFGFGIGSGGGIYNSGGGGSATLMVSNSILSGNFSDQYGGGIFNDGSPNGNATVTISNSMINGNSTVFYGGGIFSDGFQGRAAVTINNSTISGNSAVNPGSGGGGILNEGANGYAMLTITDSTISGNSATTDGGGGIYNDGSSSGSATLTINNSTLSGNSVETGGFGGGIFNYGVSGIATLSLEDTILNAGGSGANIANSSGTVTSLGYNLSSDDASTYLNQTGDQNSTNPMLAPLADNGGPTFTHALLPGSPAINAGDPNFTPPPLFDQRGPGFSRVVNGRIDIGAFEVQVRRKH